MIHKQLAETWNASWRAGTRSEEGCQCSVNSVSLKCPHHSQEHVQQCLTVRWWEPWWGLDHSGLESRAGPWGTGRQGRSPVKKTESSGLSGVPQIHTSKPQTPGPQGVTALELGPLPQGLS